jgi:hypothetical protein
MDIPERTQFRRTLMIKIMKRNFRSLVFLLLIIVAALGLFGALSSDGLAAGQANSKQSRAARNNTGSNEQSSKTKKNRSCKQVCDDTYSKCQKSAQPFPYNDWGQPGGCTAVHAECVQDCPSNVKQRKPPQAPKT